MRIMMASAARGTPLNCADYTTRKTTAGREDVNRGGYTYDVYISRLHGTFVRAVESLLAYDIFAPHRMCAVVCTADHRVALGATIVQRIVIGPLAIESAVRVVELERSADCVLFTYATAEGHAERGLASFAVKSSNSKVTFEAQAWSKPGTWLTNLASPISRSLQRAFTREAVESFCRRTGT